MAIGKTNCKIVNHRGRRKPAIGNWQLAKPTAKALTTKGTEEQQLANGNWQDQLFVYATADLP
jgi:hypothetical protein